MAKEKETKGNQKPKKRVVKKAETVRELAEKSVLDKVAKKPSLLRRVLRFIFWPLRWLGRKLAFLGRYKIVRALGRILWPAYFRNSWKELRQVTWPTRKETFRLTLAVIIFSTVFGLLITVVDFALNKLFKALLVK